ncbi:hypothetical protein [Xanthomonas sacchari]|uniref:hypothetical protein n=1 Tax=Xanthomonas sacchari TaxID=56458 RepID=UPI003B218D58
MSAQRKRHGEAAVASNGPKNQSPCEAQAYGAAVSLRDLLSELPPEAFKRSAAWHLERAHRARSIGELKNHLGAWAVRWAMFTRTIGSHFVEYGPAVFASAIASSGLRVRFRAKDVRKLCHAAARIVWG